MNEWKLFFLSRFPHSWQYRDKMKLDVGNIDNDAFVCKYN